MSENNNRADLPEQLKTAALDRIRALFDEQARCGEVCFPVWWYGLEEPEQVFLCRLSVSDPDPADTEAECLCILSGIFETSGLPLPQGTEPSFPGAGSLPDSDLVEEPDKLERFMKTWLDPLLDDRSIAKVGDYGFFRPGDEYCVCGETTPEERAAAEKRIGPSAFAPDAIAHARRLCRLLQLNAPWIILQHSATDLAESLTLHRHAISCTVIPMPAEQASGKE